MLLPWSAFDEFTTCTSNKQCVLIHLCLLSVSEASWATRRRQPWKIQKNGRPCGGDHNDRQTNSWAWYNERAEEDMQVSWPLIRSIANYKWKTRVIFSWLTGKFCPVLCRLSDDYVRLTYEEVLSRLEKEHAEIRLSAFQILNELFVRSHCLRDLFLADFQTIMDLSLGRW